MELVVQGCLLIAEYLKARARLRKLSFQTRYVSGTSGGGDYTE